MLSTGSRMAPAEQIEIRRLTAEDAHAYYGLRLEALERDPHAFTESSEEHRGITIESLAQKLGSSEENGEALVLGAFTENAFVGMVGLARSTGSKRRHKGVLWGMYVKPEWRGKGIGQVLLSEIVERAKAMPGVEQVMLGVAAENTPARRLYESLGFQSYGREPHALKVGDSYVDEDLMVLRITR
jgi:ribosomal protein S18 acetylase RimI-like enzyme